jgi:hypothetical protein|tara:strand:+ start:78 stop:512 length:435 start_codon:yes stop_codon:yes gene_type:complete
MPNHCHNRVTFYSDDKPELIQKLHKIFKSEEVFTQFVPEPDWATTPNEAGELSAKDPSEPMFPPKFPDGTVDDRWYNWRLQNWGTKWDCYEVDIDDSELEYGFEVTFDTAWSPPEEICSAIKEQFDVSISWFFDEPGMEVAGYL